jgi:hypothetical protein
LKLDQYDRSAKVTKEELSLLRLLLQEHRSGQYRKPEWFKPLSRILMPLRNAADSIKGSDVEADVAVRAILRETVERKRTIWGWSHQDWIALLREPDEPVQKSEGLPPAMANRLNYDRVFAAMSGRDSRLWPVRPGWIDPPGFWEAGCQ